ncbi:hypothetical protein HMN09_00870900 [Mycena chlorophos]|uniref:DUF6534 domain-containing protein n=1 Tax=Mycena chlorophos TaxID=658473 RepID=A0A8H6W5D5_MYCCL|nr:hypothetical protein HMN09_00870900 [Mycena chlorophos]
MPTARERGQKADSIRLLATGSEQEGSQGNEDVSCLLFFPLLSTLRCSPRFSRFHYHTGLGTETMSAAGEVDVRGTIGAAFAGALAAVGLSAVLGFQTFLYFKIFPSDVTKYKLFVPWIWLIDAAHTVVVCLTIWDYAIVNYANPSIAEHIPPTLPVNVALTAVMTLSVNIFYGSRIHRMSQRNWVLTGVITILCLARTGVAFVSTFGMLTKKTFTAFSPTYQRYLIIGLSISAATDIVISAARYYFLRNLQQGYPGAQEIVDVVVVFTLNDGCLTCAVVLASLACLVAMPHNFVWVGIYFSITKLYANSILCTLNLRNLYRRQRPLGIPLSQRQGPIASTFRGPSMSVEGHGQEIRSMDKSQKQMDIESTVEVYVDQEVEYNVSVDVVALPEKKKYGRRNPLTSGTKT